MSTIEMLFRGVLLFCALAGFMLFLHNKTKIHPSFLPIVTFCTISAVMFMAGLLNVLTAAAKALTALGCLLLLVYAWRLFVRKTGSLRPFFCPGMVFFAVACLYFIILLKGVYYQHYDNFSHWGLLVKEMFSTQSFPQEGTVVTYTNYPPGTAVFIFYICKHVGYTESHTLMAQAMLLSASLAPLFCKVCWKQYISCIALFLTAIVSVSILGSLLFTLLVDAVLGCLIAAAVLALICYRRDTRQAAIAGTPLLIMLVIVKDSGKIFFFMILALAVILWFRCQPGWFRHKSNWAGLAAMALAPLLFDKLWKAYVEKAYTSVTQNGEKFNLSLDRLLSAFRERDAALIQDLPSMLFSRLFDWQYLSSRILAAVFLLTIAVIVWFLIKKKNRSLRLVLFSLAGNVLFLLLYLFTLYVLYALIMPVGEAENLAGFDRYFATAAIAAITLQLAALIYAVKDAGFQRAPLAAGCTAAGVLAVLACVGPDLPASYTRPAWESSNRYAVQQVLEKAGPYLDSRTPLLLYDGTQDNLSGYYFYLLRYERCSAYNGVRSQANLENDEAEFMQALANADILLILEDNDAFWAGVDEAGVLRQGSPDGCVYRVEKKNGTLTLVCLA